MLRHAIQTRDDQPLRPLQSCILPISFGQHIPIQVRISRSHLRDPWFLFARHSSISRCAPIRGPGFELSTRSAVLQSLRVSLDWLLKDRRGHRLLNRICPAL
jgi:hypothetical protein